MKCRIIALMIATLLMSTIGLTGCGDTGQETEGLRLHGGEGQLDDLRLSVAARTWNPSCSRAAAPRTTSRR